MAFDRAVSNCRQCSSSLLSFTGSYIPLRYYLRKRERYLIRPCYSDLIFSSGSPNRCRSGPHLRGECEKQLNLRPFSRLGSRHCAETHSGCFGSSRVLTVIPTIRAILLLPPLDGGARRDTDHS